MARQSTAFATVGMCGLLVSLSACRESMPPVPAFGQLRPVADTLRSVVGQDAYGFNVVGIDDPGLVTDANVQAIVSYATNAGARWVRFQIWWPDADSLRNVWRESRRLRYHRVIDAFTDAGIQVMVTLKGTPEWACYGTNVSTCQDNPNTVPDDLPAWEQFVERVMIQYPKVKHWGIWNEPASQLDTNAKPGHPTMTRVAAYRELVLYAWSVKNRLGGGRKLLAPEEAQPWFMDSILKTHAWAIDVVSTHAYSQSWEQRNEIAIADQIARKYKPGGMPIWLTETGVGVNKAPVPGSVPQPTDAQQASHLTRVLNYMAGGTVANWQKTFAWHLFNPAAGDLAEFRFINNGLTSSPSYRPAYWCFRGAALGYFPDPTCTDFTECEKPPESPVGYADPRAECLVARIDGPVLVGANTTCLWKAIASGTTALSYTWYVNGVQRGTSSAFSFNSAYAINRSFQLGLKVRDGYANSRSVSKFVEVSSSYSGCL